MQLFLFLIQFIIFLLPKYEKLKLLLTNKIFWLIYSWPYITSASIKEFMLEN